MFTGYTGLKKQGKLDGLPCFLKKYPTLTNYNEVKVVFG